ncbi:GYF domain-containing protein mpd2 [Termitomyces sp. T112]|nr:GYF domain-containing protein mpd2 [Termitomyces sp. T112]
MTSTTMHFGPEWMRTKHQTPTRTQPPPSPPPGPTSGASTYSALVSPAPPQQVEKRDEVHPFRYSKEELLRIYREGGGKGGLGLEVERWEGVVREVGTDPIGLREMGDGEKKLFQGPLNSDLRRRQTTDLLSPLSTQTSGNDRSRHILNSPSSATTGSPLRDRFGALRREPSLTIPRKQSLSSLQPVSPRDAAPSPRRGPGYSPGFDGVLGGNDAWIARRRASEVSLKASAGASQEVGADHQLESKTSDIREEEENPEPNEDEHPIGEADDPDRTTASQDAGNDPPQIDGQDATADMARLSLNINGSSNPGSLNNSVSASPAITVDLAAVEWSYKDPSGQVQGPFNAELMQKWFDDGYFTGDLPMKRTHLDTQWFTVDELVKRHGGTKIFVTPPAPAIPPGLPVHRDIQNFGQEPLLFNGPYQPAPIRNLRSTTLDSFGSSASDSPSSSFGAGRFGNGSPDPNAFGGRGFFNDNAHNHNPRTHAFGTIPDPSTLFNRRNNLNDPSLDPSLAIRNSAFGNVAPNRGPVSDGFGYNRTYSPGQGWTTGPFDSSRATSDSFSSHFGNAPTNTFGAPQDVYADASSFPNGNYNSYVNGIPQSQYVPSPVTQFQQSTSNPFGATPQSASSDFNSSPAPSQSPWNPEVPVARRPGPFDSVHPTSANTVVLPSTTDTSPWGQASNSQPSRPSSQVNESSPWQPSSGDLVDDWKTPTSPDSLTFSNIVQHNQQQQQFANAAERDIPKPETPEPVSVVPAEPTSEPSEPKTVIPVKTKTKVPSVQPTPAAKSTLQVHQELTPNVPAPKAPWSKEDESKPKPSGTSVSLRDIQEAEAKKAEARKAAEREKERAVRAAQVTDPKDAAQPFIASWGLPTSQVGSRTVVTPVKEASITVPNTVNPPVWTNTSKTLATKKTMKEIQEEEERRKKNAVKETVASAARRAYAETTQKATPPVSQGGGAWTTVGAGGKPTTTLVPARPPAVQPPPVSSIPSTSARPNGNTPVPRPVSVSPIIKTATPTPKGDELPIPPSSEFMKWLSNTLKGLNSSVNVEEIMEMLISFPVEPDQATIDTVADAIYINSTTLDGRRFAAEFFSKRKADAATRKGVVSGGKSPIKPVSIADVVKATPKPTQPEWGFKVVNKKKKGGRLALAVSTRQAQRPSTTTSSSPTSIDLAVGRPPAASAADDIPSCPTSIDVTSSPASVPHVPAADTTCFVAVVPHISATDDDFVRYFNPVIPIQCNHLDITVLDF